MRNSALLGWAKLWVRGKWQRPILLSLVVVVFIAPVVWSLLASINVIPDDSRTPPTWASHASLENYADIGATTPTFVQALEGSIIVSVTATGLTSFIALLAAYGLARSRFRGVGVLVQSFLVLASVPVMAFAIPLAVIVRAMHLYDTYLGVLLTESALFAPLSVFILYGYVQQISIELEEAARLEGAGMLEIIWRVIFPLTASGVAATAIIVFVLNWNMMLVPLVLSESRVKTIPIIVSGFFYLEREIDWPSAAAILISSLLPLVVLVGAAHRVLEHFSLIPTQAAT